MRFLIAILSAFAFAVSAFANDWYVDDSATGPIYDGSQANPFNNILDAVNAAANPFLSPGSDTIYVADGNYTGPGVNADFQGNLTTIKSQNGPTLCTIDGGNTFQGFGFNSAGETGSIVDGFTFTNMSDPFGTGGSAIRVNGATIEIKNCVFSNNSSNSTFVGGGAVSLINTGTKVVNCQFVGNTTVAGSSGNGGAIFAQNSLQIRIQTCSFTGNSAVVGGAIYSDGASIILENSHITTNIADSGGGMYISGFGTLLARSSAFTTNSSVGGSGGGGAICSNSGTLMIVNCTLAGNSAVNSVGGAIQSIASPGSSVANSILWSNGANSGIDGAGDLTFDFCNVEGFANSGSNSGDDPMFQSYPIDLRLQDGSPCIDSGDILLYQVGLCDLTTDLDGIYNRPLGSGVDRGAYEKVDAVTLINGIKTKVDEIAQTTALPADGHPLKQKLDQAASAVIAGDPLLAVQRLNEFIIKVNQMVPKKLTAAQATELVGMAQDVIALLVP